jgi:hypothetical protein
MNTLYEIFVPDDFVQIFSILLYCAIALLDNFSPQTTHRGI